MSVFRVVTLESASVPVRKARAVSDAPAKEDPPMDKLIKKALEPDAAPEVTASQLAHEEIERLAREQFPRLSQADANAAVLKRDARARRLYELCKGGSSLRRREAAAYRPPVEEPASVVKAGSAAAQIERDAQVLVDAGEVKTVHEGIALVAKRRPDLYARHQVEQRARAADA